MGRQLRRGWSDNPAWVIYDILTDGDWGSGFRRAASRPPIFTGLPGGVTRPSMAVRSSPSIVLRKRRGGAARRCAAIHVMFFWSGGKLFALGAPADPVALVTCNVVDGEFVYHGPARAVVDHAVLTYHDQDEGGQLAVETAIDHAGLHRHGYRGHEVFLAGCGGAPGRAGTPDGWWRPREARGGPSVAVPASIFAGNRCVRGMLCLSPTAPDSPLACFF